MDPLPPGARRVSVAAERLDRWIDNFAERHPSIETTATPHRVIIRAGDGTTAWIDVPFPPLVVVAGRGLATLSAHVRRERRVGVLLVRRGGHAAGRFDGSRLVASKVGSSYVQGTTKAGGWSQQRYAHRRANQARVAFRDAADAAARVLAGDDQELQALFCGGARDAVEAVLADPRLEPLRELVRPPWLTVPDPRLSVLRGAPAQFRSVTVHVLP